MNNKKYDKVYYPVRKVTDIKDMIVSSSELYKDHPAYMVKDRPGGSFEAITFGQLREDMDALGTKLISMGLKGKKIAVIGSTSYQWLLTYFATVCGVGVIVPLDRNLPENEIINLVERAEVSALVFAKSSEKNLKSIFANKPKKIEFLISMATDEHKKSQEYSVDIFSLKALVQEGKRLVRDGIRDYVDVTIDPEAMSSLLFTSGTTGQSKGVMLSHRNIVSNVYNMSKLVNIPKTAVVLSILPVHHVYEMTCTIFTCLYQGVTVGISEGLKYIQKNICELHASTTLGVPLIFEKMYRAIWRQAEGRGEAEKLRKAIDLSRKMKLYDKPFLMKKLFKPIHQLLGNNIYLLIAGGAAIDPKVIEDFEAMGLPMIQGYGMTENAPIIAVNQDRYSKAASVGKPMPGTEVKIIDEDEFGIGEIICKGPSVMIGYYGDKEATNEVLKNGWLYTGDYGYFDEEGFLYITGRKKNVIVTKGGKNIFPEEVEQIIGKNPAIEEVLVHGVEDERIGNIAITADIFPNYDILKENKGEMTESEIYHFFKSYINEVNKTLPPYKHVKRINVQKTEFEKTTSGKIKRFIIKDHKGRSSEGNIQESRIKAEEMARAMDKIKRIQDSEDPVVRYKNIRPIVNIKQMVETSVGKFGDNKAYLEKFDVKQPFTTVTYKQTLADINSLGTALINRGLKGEKIAILGRNSYDWSIAYLAVSGGAGISVPLERKQDEDKLISMIKKAEIKALIYNTEHESLIEKLKSEEEKSGKQKIQAFIFMGKNNPVKAPEESSLTSGLSTIKPGTSIISMETLKEEGKAQIAQGDRQYLDGAINSGDVCEIFITKEEKAIEITHENLMDNLMSISAVIKINPYDTFYSIMAAHDPFERTCGFLLPFYMGAAVVFSKKETLTEEELKEVNPTVALGAKKEIQKIYKETWEFVEEAGFAETYEKRLGWNKYIKALGLDLNRKMAMAAQQFLGGKLRLIIFTDGDKENSAMDFFAEIGIQGVRAWGIPGSGPILIMDSDQVKQRDEYAKGHLLPDVRVKTVKASNSEVGELHFASKAIPKSLLEDGWYNSKIKGIVDRNNYLYLSGGQK